MKTFYHSPVGWLALIATDEALLEISFLETEPDTHLQKSNAVIKQTVAQLSEYFDGTRKDFSIPLQLGGTDFQQSVWEELQAIPYGQTTSYGKLAKKLGDPKKVRAVGRANGQNSIPIIIPCHRVIGSNGNLTGYAGGVARKRRLLQHEGVILL